ncbi:MAG: hypothetical protein HY062_17750 [Bacteroidetes bacterium]|nr:hypothetical protein [Bacteroidota bacterium]
MAKTKSYNLFVIVAFAALAYPMIAGFLKKNNKPNLTGIVINDVNPDSLLKQDKGMWFSGEYQNLKDDYNNDHWAFKESFVRLNNQFYYNAFNQLRVNNFVSGKENYVYSEGYIFSAFGDDYMGEEKIASKLQKAKVVQDSLKRKGIDLLLVFAPGKGEYCMEYIDDKYKHPIQRSNYQSYIEQSGKLGLHVLDLKAWFHTLKPKTPYPLFPKFGHHWSFYGECLAVDTIIGHIEHLHHCDLPDIVWNKIDVVDTARSRDADVLKSMNLYKNPSQNMKLAYPEVMFEQDSMKNRTRVLTISDSYWYGPVYMGVGQSCFAGGQFWYYYNKIIPNPSPTEKVEVWQLDLKQNIESNQVIMLLYSDGNLPSFANTFIEDAYELYTNPKAYYARVEKQKSIKQFEKQIREKPVLLKKATQKSNDLQIPLDSAIKLDAMKLAGLIK